VPDETPLQEIDREGTALAAERQMLFTDAVVAIAITLLALELPVPKGPTNVEFWHQLSEGRSEYESFLISFLVIWAHWSGHRRMFRSVAGFDRTLSSLNGLWLLMIVIIPFATKVIGGGGAFQARFGLYALIQTLTCVIFLLMAWHVKRARLYREGVPLVRFTRGMIRSGILGLGFAVSIPVSFVTGWSYLCWILAPVISDLIERRSRLNPEPAGGRPAPDDDD
jgi:uncharacterized membrane protein